MNNEDSFNDCDEVFSLYSSEKVRDTFKAQLKKIAANHELNNPLSFVNVVGCKKQEENINENVTNITQQKMSPAPQQNTEPVLLIEEEQNTEPVLLIEDEAPYSPLDFSDSIEVIKEITPRATRRSERLRKKANPVPQNSVNNSSCNKGNKRSTRSRKNLPRGKLQQKSVCEITLEDSPQQIENDDELNPEVIVKVIWKSVNLKKFQVRKFQKFSHIFELLSKEENIPEEKIMLTFNNIRVTPNDTTDSLNLQVYHFLDGGVLSELSNLCQTSNENNSDYDTDTDMVVLKFQGANKNIIKINLNKNEKLKVGMIKCSEQLEIPLDKIRFFFDGELIEPHETPASLGLENEEIIDIKIT